MGIVTSDIRYHASWIGSQLKKKEKIFGLIKTVLAPLKTTTLLSFFHLTSQQDSKMTQRKSEEKRDHELEHNNYYKHSIQMMNM